MISYPEKNRVLSALWGVILITFPFAVGATFEDGVDAFNRSDFVRAAQEWQPLARNGDADAARNLARIYHQGLGLKVDFEKARYWYQLAANKCDATAQNNLGLLILNGQGGGKDDVAAFRLFESAAQQGLHADSDAMGNLAGLYASGRGTQANVIEAYKWYLLYGEYTTDALNRRKLELLLPQVEKYLTTSQKAEAIRRAHNFRKIKCVPK